MPALLLSTCEHIYKCSFEITEYIDGRKKLLVLTAIFKGIYKKKLTFLKFVVL